MRSKMLVWKIVLIVTLTTCVFRPAFGETQAIINGGFELINAGEWQISGAGAYITNGPFAASGAAYLTMGNIAGANQAVFQTITFPTNMVSATFGFQYGLVSSDTFAADDILSVYILDTNHLVLASLGSTSNTVPTPSYVQVMTNLATYAGSNNVSLFAGKTVQVYFQSTTDSTFGFLTSFFIDNVSVLVGTTSDVAPNDNFGNSASIPANAFIVSVSGTNRIASREPGEPVIAGNAGGRSIWYNWTAPGIGTVTLNTSGSSFTNLLGVYTGTSITNLTLVASNNGNNRGGPAQVTFNVSPGVTYQIAVDGYNGQSGAIALNLKFTLDTKAPAVSITSPASGAKLTNSTVIVRGKATDNIGVSLVQLRLENAFGTNDYQTATGANIWSAQIDNLSPGPNTIRVRAIDTSSNISATVTRSVTFVVVSPLTLTVNGGGTVTPNLNGKLLGVGNSFTLIAKPAPGNIFAGWTGDLESSSPTLKFAMQSNMVLHAEFIPNPFIPLAGNYQGLVFDDNNVAHQSSGFFNGKVTSAGAYTAKVLLGGASYSLSGKFSASGSASNSILLKTSQRVSVQLQLDMNGGGLMGPFQSADWTSQLSAFRAVSNAPLASYTMLLPAPNQEDPAQPGGDGFATVKVGTLAAVTFSGSLGDGTKFSQKTILTPNGQSPFYSSLYSGKGSIFGWLNISRDSEQITGPVSWFKQAFPGKFYAAGFTNQINSKGSFYQFSNGVPVLDFTNGQIWLANGNVSPGFTNNITIDADNKVTNQSSNALSLTITTASGLFRGTVVNPATKKSVPISGVVLQKQNFGGGFFSGTNQTGNVYFGP
jgi:hypothetical protein